MSAIRITGTLGRDAECRIGTDGSAWVYLEIHCGADTLAVQVRRRVGTGPAAQIAARSAARELRRGSAVTDHAGGYSIQHLPTPHLLLEQVDFVEHRPIAARHEPRDAVEITLPQAS